VPGTKNPYSEDALNAGLNGADHRGMTQAQLSRELKDYCMDNDKRRRRDTWYAISIIIASIFINADGVQFQPLALWARIIIPVLLVAGFLGNKLQNTLLRIIGWVGIALFCIVASAAALPGEEYVLGHYTNGPPEVGTLHILIRLFVALAITSLLVVSCQRRVKKPELRP